LEDEIKKKSRFKVILTFMNHSWGFVFFPYTSVSATSLVSTTDLESQLWIQLQVFQDKDDKTIVQQRRSNEMKEEKRTAEC
jgi:hypothetical protein